MKHYRLHRSLFLAIMVLCASSVHAELTIESSIDWENGRFVLLASMLLGEETSPDDHPRAIETLERDLPPYVIRELSRISWDNRGSIGELLEREPSMRPAVEGLASSMEREWSRISEDYRSVEASYSLNLGDKISELFPVSHATIPPGIPPGWYPVPEDDWSGIIIYVPGELPLRGTGLTAAYLPALRARILTDSLEVLVQPTAMGTPSYFHLDNRDRVEEFVGRRPYRTMARGLYGESPCDIILSEDDSRKILASESGRRSLTDGRIVILVDAIAE